MSGGNPCIALAGNPNVGKSTLFNALTGLRQHTGNWAGKTVSSAQGQYSYLGTDYRVVDLPGTYSLTAHSPEEEVARDFIAGGEADGVVVVCDATCLERNLILALQVLELKRQVVVCVNLMDEARRLGVQVDLEGLSRRLGVPVVGLSAGRQEGLEELKQTVAKLVNEVEAPPPPARSPEERVSLAERYAAQVVRSRELDALRRQRRWDQLLTSGTTGIPLMLLLLGGVIGVGTVLGMFGTGPIMAPTITKLAPIVDKWAGTTD